MAEHEKDIFVVHSRGDPSQERLYHGLKETVGDLGLTLWDYGDWLWETSGVPEHKNYGTADQLDPVLAAAGDPNPFRHETVKPDADALQELWSGSSAILILEAREKPSSGVLAELNNLERFNLRTGSNPPIVVSVGDQPMPPPYLQDLPISYRLESPCEEDGGEVATDVVALVVLAWLFHLLRSFGTAGVFLLTEASLVDPVIREFTEVDPGHRDLDFGALQAESRARERRVLAEESAPTDDLSEYISRRVAKINDEWDREAKWNSRTPEVVSWLRRHREEHVLVETGCLVIDCFERRWAEAFDRFRYAVVWPRG